MDNSRVYKTELNQVERGNSYKISVIFVMFRKLNYTKNNKRGGRNQTYYAINSKNFLQKGSYRKTSRRSWK